MDSLSLNSVYSRSQDVVFREVAGEVLLVPISGKLADMDQLFSVNEVGAFIWRQLDGEATLQDLLDTLVEIYEVDEPSAWSDLQELIADLKAARLVVEVKK